MHLLSEGLLMSTVISMDSLIQSWQQSKLLKERLIHIRRHEFYDNIAEGYIEMEITKLQDDLSQSQAKITDMKTVATSKDAQITVINRELNDAKRSMGEQKLRFDRTLRNFNKKCAEIVELKSEINQMKEQLQISEAKMKSWPYWMLSWLDRSYYARFQSNIVHFKNMINAAPFKIFRKVLRMFSGAA